MYTCIDQGTVPGSSARVLSLLFDVPPQTPKKFSPSWLPQAEILTLVNDEYGFEYEQETPWRDVFAQPPPTSPRCARLIRLPHPPPTACEYQTCAACHCGSRA
jgi:hypothetical protein